jgi:ribonuclease Z
LSFIVTILGSNSATPAFNRNPTSQLLRIGQEHLLVDCGEGTQMRLLALKQRASRIRYIFISHLHGDHYLGLVGLLSSLHLNGREEDLHLFGPPGLAEIITTQFKYSNTYLCYHIHFHPVSTTPETILDADAFTVSTLPLSHRIHCMGFLFREKTGKRRINKDLLPPTLSVHHLKRLKEGKDLFDPAGNLLHRNEDLTLPPRQPRSYAFCSDTRYEESLVDYVRGVSLLYHESTFLDDQRERAAETFHSTARQAATIAKLAEVGKLVLGHYSSRYRDLTPFLTEAREVFPNSVLSIEGDDIEVE